jgi:hypothetical protein
MFDMIVQARPEQRKRRDENEQPAARAQPRKNRSNQLLIFGNMLEHIQRVDVINRFGFLFIDRRSDREAALAQNCLVFRVWFHTIDRQPAGAQ